MAGSDASGSSRLFFFQWPCNRLWDMMSQNSPPESQELRGAAHRDSTYFVSRRHDSVGPTIPNAKTGSIGYNQCRKAENSHAGAEDNRGVSTTQPGQRAGASHLDLAHPEGAVAHLCTGICLVTRSITMQQTANQQMRRLKRQQRKRQARRERGPLVHHEATPVSRWAFIRHYFCPR
jgi:hypothetical protein